MMSDLDPTLEAAGREAIRRAVEATPNTHTMECYLTQVAFERWLDPEAVDTAAKAIVERYEKELNVNQDYAIIIVGFDAVAARDEEELQR